jgi:PAS domain-containing protein
MKIRALVPSDIDEIRRIHEQFYKEEFDFPDFLNNFLCAFVVTDEDGKIISAGGVRAIAESVIVTDKNFSVRDRRQALYQVLDVSEFITKHADFKELHAFVQDTTWISFLMTVGFCPTKGKALVLELQ